MTTALTTTELVQLLSLMQQMLACAQSSQWEALQDLDDKRARILNVDSDQVDSNDERRNVTRFETNPDRSTLVNDIVGLDKQILAEIRKARSELISESSGLRNQIKARDLYAKASALSSHPCK